jgi:hypothetical protein
MWKHALFAAASLLLLGGLARAADALWHSDAEVIEDFVSGFEKTKNPAKHALVFVDVSRVPLDIVQGDVHALLNEEREWELPDMADRAFAPFAKEGAKVVEHYIEFRGSDAFVAVRAETPDGEQNGYFTFTDRNGSWFLREVRIP